MELIAALSSCLCGFAELAPPVQSTIRCEVDEKALLLPPIQVMPTVKQVSIDLVSLLRLAEQPGADLNKQLDQAVGVLGWSEWVAENVLQVLVKTLEKGTEKMGPAMRVAYEDAVKAAHDEFEHLVQEAKDHPLETAATILLIIVALGVLVALTPYILELLGFSELGPMAGSFAARWEATYLGRIPAGSLFSFFQRLGMTWTRV